jgi:hypothetical protein
MITSQRLSDLKNSTDQCEFISNLCTWRSKTTSMQIELMRWVVFIQCVARCYISVLITCESRDDASYIECINSMKHAQKNIDEQINRRNDCRHWEKTWFVFFEISINRKIRQCSSISQKDFSKDDFWNWHLRLKHCRSEMINQLKKIDEIEIIQKNASKIV